MKKKIIDCTIDFRNVLTPDELVKRYKNKVCKRTLANWRCKGKGPTPTKFGGRVFYAINDVKKWEKTL